ncbi:anti-sigma-I factor RsgI6-like isoform X2 [Littorina saxatilis]|uniref:anti-sigma-I factor RsgI6-like isoform X2 n=1 Tax=Littorina saxatilis TaxID=31220 RepID=UPI0038B42B0F
MEHWPSAGHPPHARSPVPGRCLGQAAGGGLGWLRGEDPVGGGFSLHRRTDQLQCRSRTLWSAHVGWLGLPGGRLLCAKCIARVDTRVLPRPQGRAGVYGGRYLHHRTAAARDRLLETYHSVRHRRYPKVWHQHSVVQKTRPFPFGTAVACSAYNTKSRGNYRDFIHKHFNWAVTENALKWKVIESTQGQRHYQQALDCVRGLRSNNIKVRGHNLVWSVPVNVQGWQKALSGDILRRTVKNHITDVMNVTRRLLEHWDVNNENLHGTWYQDRLHDPDYDLELFRIAHAQDSHVKLFLNDFSVVAQGASTYAYLNQTIRFKAANVGLYGIGVQCHFPDEMEPNPDIIRHRLDILAQAGVPIWVTELDVMSKDDNRRADFYEMALSALFSHPAVEGIMLWGFWDKFSWRGEAGALVKGDHLELTAAGRRVFDLLENQWMTDETYVLSQTSDHFTLRGFHGDYEVRVHYQGKELGNLTQTFTLGDDEQDVTVHMHT